MRETGYCRISSSHQNIDRQVRNILQAYPDAEIIKEVYTGTKFQGRNKLNRILEGAREGDTIIFDSVCRMSRDAEEGFQVYEDLYNRGVTLVFLKEPHINTDTYKKALENRLDMTGDIVDYILDGINRYMLGLGEGTDSTCLQPGPEGSGRSASAHKGRN